MQIIDCLVPSYMPVNTVSSTLDIVSILYRHPVPFIICNRLTKNLSNKNIVGNLLKRNFHNINVTNDCLFHTNLPNFQSILIPLIWEPSHYSEICENYNFYGTELLATLLFFVVNKITNRK